MRFTMKPRARAKLDIDKRKLLNSFPRNADMVIAGVETASKLKEKILLMYVAWCYLVRLSIKFVMKGEQNVRLRMQEASREPIITKDS